MGDRDQDVHVGPPVSQHVEQFNQVDDCLDAVTAGKDDDNDDENGGDIEVSPFSLGGLGQ